MSSAIWVAGPEEALNQLVGVDVYCYHFGNLIKWYYRDPYGAGHDGFNNGGQ